MPKKDAAVMLSCPDGRFAVGLEKLQEKLERQSFQTWMKTPPPKWFFAEPPNGSFQNPPFFPKQSAKLC